MYEQTGSSTQVVSRGIPLKTASVKGCVGQTATMRFPLLLPQDLWIALWNSSSFSKYILRDLDVEHLVRFWHEVGNHPAVKFHPIKQMENFERRAVPLILHGDGAAVTQQIGAGTKSCLFLSFRSMVGQVNQHFLMASCWTHIAAKGSTMHTSKSIFSILVKSFLDMQHEEGARSGGFIGLPVFTSGDLEYFNEFHQLPRWNANHPCPLCSVHKIKLMDWNSSQEVKPDLWRVPRNHNCPLFRMLMSPQAVSPDWMHSKLLGIDQRFLSSVCWLLIFQLGDPNASLDDRLFRLLHEMKTYWHTQSIDYGFNNLTLGCLIVIFDHVSISMIPIYDFPNFVFVSSFQ